MSEDITKEPLPPSKAEPRGARPEYPEVGFDAGPRFPRTVVAASIVWIVFGCLLVLNMVLALLATAVVPAVVGDHAAMRVAGSVCGSVIVGLIGAVFIRMGFRSFRGAAGSTLGNGVGSIGFSLLVLLLFAVFVNQQGLSVAAGILGVVGAMLLAAGALAFAGENGYQRWRQAQKAQRDTEARARIARDPEELFRNE